MDFRELVKVGAHFGHVKSRLNPKMNPYIWGVKNNVHLIDVSKTAVLVEKAAKFLESVAASGKPILWIGTKKSAKGLIQSIAEGLKMPYVSHRWIGGTLSNYSQVKKSVTKLLHYEDVLSKTEKFPHYTKKELNMFGKLVDRLKKNIGGIRNLKWPIGAVVIVDAVKELSALREAATVGIPVVAIVDTNGDPSLVDYVVPANDDSVRSVKLILDYLSESADKGKQALRQAQDGREKEKPEKKPAKAKPVPKKEADKKPEAKKLTEKKPEAKKQDEQVSKKIVEKEKK
ncbi:30S ribosomal protein S2 [Candidatus Dependentiae bacterium]